MRFDEGDCEHEWDHKWQTTSTFSNSAYSSRTQQCVKCMRRRLVTRFVGGTEVVGAA